MYERKNYIVAVIALVVSLGGFVLAYLAINASWEIAELSGSLDKAELEVGLSGFPLASGRTNRIVIGASNLSSGNIPSIGVLPFSFKSKGKKSLDSLSISFQYHPLFRRDILEHGNMRASGAFASTEMKRSALATADRFFVNYVFPNLNPGVTAEIHEPIFLAATSIRNEVPVTTKDGVEMVVPVSVQFAINFGLVVSARDTQVQGYSISVAMEKATTLQQLVSGQHKQYVQQRQDQVRKELGFPSYLAALISSSPTEAAFLVFVPQKKMTAGGATVFAPLEKLEVAVETYPLLSWSLLFGEPK